MTHPKKWYIPVTKENHAELNRWRLSKRTLEASKWDEDFVPGSVLVSEHPSDGSYFYTNKYLRMAQSLDNYPTCGYQEITLEQFRQITNPQPMTHPEHWCIEATKENFSELKAWWEENADTDFDFQVGYTLMSEHPHDPSKYYAGYIKYCIEEYPQFVEITLEQFRQITNPQPVKHPEHWCIEATKENFLELKAWWGENANTNFHFKVGHTLMSDHPYDESKYYSGSIAQWLDNHPQFTEITLEQFRQITNSNQTQTTMSKSIRISRELLNEYYNAATIPQKEYLTEHFKLDGTTTVEAIRGLHDMACGGWKPRIKKNHPDCFPEDSKYFDFSRYVRNKSWSFVSKEVCESLGLVTDFIQVRNNSSNLETHHRSFFLSSEYKWELKFDEGAMVLIPTKKS